MTIQLLVNDQILSIHPSQKDTRVVADSKNYLKVQFVFNNPEWKKSGLLYALFTYEGKTYKKFLGIEDGVKWNECYVAPEVIKPGAFSVSVFAGDLITSSRVEIPVDPSGFTEEIENQPVTPSTLEQMNTLMYKYADLCNQIYNECTNIQKSIKGGER